MNGDRIIVVAIGLTIATNPWADAKWASPGPKSVQFGHDDVRKCYGDLNSFLGIDTIGKSGSQIEVSGGLLRKAEVVHEEMFCAASRSILGTGA